MPHIPANIADHVGNTPMIRLARLVPDGVDVELYGKLEAFNPGGSVKDRIGVAMLDAAEREGRIEPGRTTIVEATSGNTGIALAFCCAAKGYDLTIFLPQGMSREREALLRLYGARVEIVESMGGMNEAVDAARAAARAVQAQQRLALAAHALRQEDREVVALGRAAERERDAGVAGRRLDERRLPRFYAAFGLGGGDHRDSDPVLDRAARVERLELSVDLGVDVVGHESGEPHHRRVADGRGDVDRDRGHHGGGYRRGRPGSAV